MAVVITILFLLSTIRTYSHEANDFKNEVKLKAGEVKTLQTEKENLVKEVEKNKQEIESKTKELEEANKKLEARAAPIKTVVAGISNTGCETYRPLLASYDWPVDIAMLTMSKESGCNPNQISATQDHGLFQLHLEPIYDPASNVARAYQKYVSARVGYKNFSAWYAVCTPGNNPQPKYSGVKCQ